MAFFAFEESVQLKWGISPCQSDDATRLEIMFHVDLLSESVVPMLVFRFWACTRYPRFHLF